ncbi:Heterokaryon incompatibility protein [Hyphodiscus hymeniophilus]|uniref:Heterokaryon incompatibility protein n=1 Tax=Hyphodiscus hymeniophilus TaxID=353542 RepID=A0A9P6VFR1_9HELO|nr:Heterokaryon incompatibility protein [Hyphodiscus hymeniophilus]
MDKYQYKPLPPGYAEIRLVRLQPAPARSNSPIEIEIFHVELSSQPVYKALSYAWGSDERTDAVNVLVPRRKSRISSGHRRFLELRIASNLAIALRHLRHTRKSRTLWIDAISINQDDLDERGTEVLEMGSIYRNAQEVIVWLGPERQDSALALQTLTAIGVETTFDEEKHLVSCKSDSWPDILNNDTEALALHARNWFAIKELLTREWFSRLWVFQEISLAQKATLFVGECSLDWETAILGLYWVWMMGAKLDQLIESLDIRSLFSNKISPFMAGGCKQKVQHILDILKFTRGYHCRDPRDRLYAIRSLVAPWHSKIIVPDYSQTVEEVYTSFAKKWLSELGGAQFLGTFEHSSHLNLPSWVPDWSRGNLASANYSDLVVQASGISGAFATLSDGDSLGVQGVLVTSLTDVTSPAGTLTTESEIRQLCRSWWQLVLEGEPAENWLSTGHDSFIETITLGFVGEMQPSKIQTLPTFDEFKVFLSGGSDNHTVFYIRQAIQGQSLFQTANGNFGIGSPFARTGDRIAVILGCNFALILRQEMSSGRDCFRIVGPCYISGIMNSETLLGPLPSGWNARFEIVQDLQLMMFMNGDIRTQQDPRMPLPPDWRYMYGGYEGALQETEADTLEDMMLQWFENTKTGEWTKWDPRLTPGRLRERGVAVEEIILI